MLVFLAAAWGGVAPADAAEFNHDGVDRADPRFVTASLLVMSPGDELYSCAGHSCLRLECPTYNLDYSFSYESESVKDRIFTFFRGRLKMGMFAIPTADYLKLGREFGRGVMQYRLNLPPDAKQRLWKLLDDKVAEGPNLPYDYLDRGCAQSDLTFLREALKPYVLTITAWPIRYRQTRREFVDAFTAPYPWQRFFLHAICGTELDRTVSNLRKIVVPTDLLEFLRTATVNGTPLITDAGIELVGCIASNPSSVGSRVPRDRALIAPPGGLRVRASDGRAVAPRPPDVPNRPSRAVRFTPLAASVCVLALSVVNFVLRWAWLDWAFLAFLSLAGAFFTYLVFVSNLPATGWNWLIVPFNLLPLVFWTWRRRWAAWFAVVLVEWICAMVVFPHRLTDPAYLVLAAAYVVFFLKFTRFGDRLNFRALIGRSAPRPPCPGAEGTPRPTSRHMVGRPVSGRRPPGGPRFVAAA